MSESHSELSTDSAARYLARLANHWKHRFTVTRGDGIATIDFGGSGCVLKALPDKLEISVTTENDAAIDELQEVVAEHLQRVGQIENMRLVWSRAA